MFFPEYTFSHSDSSGHTKLGSTIEFLWHTVDRGGIFLEHLLCLEPQPPSKSFYLDQMMWSNGNVCDRGRGVWGWARKCVEILRGYWMLLSLIIIEECPLLFWWCHILFSLLQFLSWGRQVEIPYVCWGDKLKCNLATSPHCFVSSVLFWKSGSAVFHLLLVLLQDYAICLKVTRPGGHLRIPRAQ